MKKETLLNQETDIVLEDLENSKRTTFGLAVIGIAIMLCQTIYTCSVLTQKKALQSKCDSLEVSNKSLKDNLLMPKSIKDDLE